jgi:predicted MPP superfamily phosphohydrolase
VVHTKLKFPSFAGGAAGGAFTVAHLSDLHLGKWTSAEQLSDAVRRTLQLKPDVVCLTGDFITQGQSFDPLAYTGVLRPLAQAVPTYACLGNHDGNELESRTLRAALDTAGVNLLYNNSTSLVVQGRKVQFVGMGDLWKQECRPDEAFRTVSPEQLAICLSHNPDSKELFNQRPWQLLLSGHTHGGQCGIPGIGAALAPVKDKRFIDGMYAYGPERYIHVNRGVGNLHGIRILCRPEISVIHIS